MTAVTGRLRGSVLGIRDFRLLWVGQAVSTIGDQIFPVAVTIAVLNAGGTATDIGLVLAARWAALVLFAVVGGVWADRLPRTLVMRAADAFRMVAVLGL
ncbi:MAG: MFS transporter, partial [Actinomycetes bacterium]